MRDLRFHDGFFPVGSNQSYRAVTLEAGLTWMDVYAAAAVDRNLVRVANMSVCINKHQIIFSCISSFKSTFKEEAALVLEWWAGILEEAMAHFRKCSALGQPTCSKPR